MGEPIISSTALVTATTGITIFGFATGLQPELLLAGLAGAIWSQSHAENMSLPKRLSIGVVGAFVGAFLAPLSSVIIFSTGLMPETVDHNMLQIPTALIIGLIAHSVLGPMVLRLAKRRASEMLNSKGDNND